MKLDLLLTGLVAGILSFSNVSPPIYRSWSCGASDFLPLYNVLLFILLNLVWSLASICCNKARKDDAFHQSR